MTHHIVRQIEQALEVKGCVPGHSLPSTSEQGNGIFPFTNRVHIDVMLTEWCIESEGRGGVQLHARDTGLYKFLTTDRQTLMEFLERCDWDTTLGRCEPADIVEIERLLTDKGRPSDGCTQYELVYLLLSQKNWDYGALFKAVK
jgi:hypothetical protein